MKAMLLSHEEEVMRKVDAKLSAWEVGLTDRIVEVGRHSGGEMLALLCKCFARLLW